MRVRLQATRTLFFGGDFLVSLYFGLPGAGKTTLAVKHILEARQKGMNVFTNIDVKIDGVFRVDRDDLGRYNISNGLVVIDEASLVYDNRAFKDFKRKDMEFNLLHRHDHIDIEYFTQKFDGVDSKIRNITTNVYWIRKQPIRRWISKAILVPYGIVFPDRNSNNVGEIVNGYYQPGFWARFGAEKCKRKRYYKYFDSWATRYLPPLPGDRKIIYPWSWGTLVKIKGFSLDQ